MILDELADHARERVRMAQERLPLEQLRAQALALGPARHRFAQALAQPGLSFICELKKASPSKGVISESFPYRTILHDYERGGADAISCLTEPKWFLGSDEIFQDVRASTPLPLIRKDFTVSDYQLYEARAMGADAVLLIVSLLDRAALEHFLGICDELGLDALVETHDQTEIETALEAGARLVGVNNRNLKDFTVDFANAEKLRTLVPKDRLFVAESGVSTIDDVRAVAALSADAVLMGEALMRAKEPAKFLQQCREAAWDVRDELGLDGL